MPVVRTKKTLKQVVKGKLPKTAKRQKEPLWKGPEVDGVTQSLLSSFLVCRERFRLQVIEGLGEPDEFSHALEYGNMWHECEEGGKDWPNRLKMYCKGLCRKYPLQQEQIVHWMNVCKTAFTTYLKFWKGYDRKEKIKPLLKEHVFSVPYKLPSGRVVILRGKWDGVCLAGNSVYLWENKTKGVIVEQLLRRQLTFDLQTMFYFAAFCESSSEASRHGTPKGLIYNVVRRPLSGGKGSISRLKEKVYKRKDGTISKRVPEEAGKAFYERLRVIIEEDPGYFFVRWKVGIFKADVNRFKREFLDPILEQLCDWYGWVSNDNDPFGMNLDTGGYIHWRHPYGVWNPMDQGRPSEMDEYLASGSELGLVRRDKLFEELE